MIANNFNDFINMASDALRKGLNTEMGQELTPRLLQLKLAENPHMTQEEWSKAKSEFMTFLFCEIVKENPELMHELAMHTYNELQNA